MKDYVIVGSFAVGVIIGFASLVALSGLVIWALWNALIPAIFGGPSITYVQGVLVGVAFSIFGSIFGRR